MRCIRVEEITGKEKVGKHVIDINGRVLLSVGMQLQKQYINKLMDMGVEEVYIEDELSQGIVPDSIVSDETRLAARKIISQEAKRLLTKKDINIMYIYKIVDLIINDILHNKDSLINIKDLRSKDEELFAHCVNTAIMAAIVGKKMEFTYEKLSNLVCGCMIHDLGKLFLPNEINKMKSFDMPPAEFEIYKMHPQIGYDILKERVDINPTVRIIVLMHHERLDGTGFPEGIADKRVHEFARICAVCDAFDNMCNNTTIKHTRTVTDAVEFLNAYSGTYFEPEIVNLLLRFVPIYPVGTIVYLSNGLFAIVVKNNECMLLRPMVRAFYDSKINQKIKPIEIDLMKELNVKIEREITDNSHIALDGQ